MAILAAAALLRLAVAIASRPIIFFDDSWTYLRLARQYALVGFAPDRPSGYPLLIELLSLPGRGYWTIAAAQHLAGLAVGVLVYALLIRLGSRRWVAAAAAALVLFDSYSVALEQHVMPEAFFSLGLTASAFLAVATKRGAASLAGSGALLAGAVLIRVAALFAAPVWLAYVLISKPGRRALAASVLALAAPLLAYSAVHASQGRSFGFTDANGWFLYGRIAEIADCSGIDVEDEARPLCPSAAERKRHEAGWYVWNPESPANRAFGGIYAPDDRLDRSEQILSSFSKAIIRQRPLDYARIVARDFGRFFVPGSRGQSQRSKSALKLPARTGSYVPDQDQVQRFAVEVPRTHGAGAVVQRYQSIFHTPRWLLAAFVLISALALALGRGRGEDPGLSLRRPQTAFLLFSGLAMLLGSALTAGFVLRYLIPVVPLLACAGALALEDGAALMRARRARSG